MVAGQTDCGRRQIWVWQKMPSTQPVTFNVPSWLGFSEAAQILLSSGL